MGDRGEVPRGVLYEAAGLIPDAYWNERLKKMSVADLANYPWENMRQVSFVESGETVLQMENTTTPEKFHSLFPSKVALSPIPEPLPVDLLIMGQTENMKPVGWRLAVISYDGKRVEDPNAPSVNEFHVRWYRKGNQNPEMSRMHVPTDKFGEASAKWDAFILQSQQFVISPVEAGTKSSTKRLGQEYLAYDNSASYVIRVPEDRTYLVAKV